MTLPGIREDSSGGNAGAGESQAPETGISVGDAQASEQAAPKEFLNDRRILAFFATARSRLAMPEKVYRQILFEKFGVASARQLTREQAAELMDFFRTLGFGHVKRKYTCLLCSPRPNKDAPIPKDVVYPVSGAQLAVIDEFQKRVKWRDPEGFKKWLSKYFGIAEVTTSPQATRVITALQGLLRSQKQACGACPFKSGLKEESRISDEE